MMAASFDPVTTTASDLQVQLERGTLTSEQIVEIYLAQIERHNADGLNLRAIISVAPKASVLAKAKELDLERSAGRVRGPLHGIPIIIKDAIMTDPSLGMDTTVGAHVFAGSRPKRNAMVVEQLIEAGVVILGKSNMSEFCGLKADPMRPGWSSILGQTQSPFQKEGLEDKDQPTAGGSSSGSAASIAAGFSPLAIGTETSGSHVYPASCCGLYGLRLTLGTAPLEGVFGLSRAFDGLGAMAKSPRDVATLATTMVTSNERERLTNCLQNDSKVSWKDISVAIVPPTWGLYEKPKWETPAVKKTYEAVVDRIRELGGNALYPAELPEEKALNYNEKPLIMSVAFHEFPDVFQHFVAQYESPRVRNLTELIKWNEDHADVAMPEPYRDQKMLKDCHDQTMSDEESAAAYAHAKKTACETMDKFMEENGVNIIISNSDATLVSWAACSGWPIATVPLSNMESNDQPYGLFLIARERREDLLLQFMSAFEASFPPIRRPSQLMI